MNVAGVIHIQRLGGEEAGVGRGPLEDWFIEPTKAGLL